MPRLELVRSRPSVRDAGWFVVLERFGLPTLLVLVLVSHLIWRERQDAQEREQLVGALAANTAALHQVAAATERSTLELTELRADVADLTRAGTVPAQNQQSRR